MDAREIENLRRNLMNKIAAGRARNVEEVKKFFMSIYEIETDPIAPMSVAEAFPDIDIPDIRKPGSTLEELYPNFVNGVLNSQAYREDLHKISVLCRQVRARADELNQEAIRECERM